jgi:hypothetical protein
METNTAAPEGMLIFTEANIITPATKYIKA